MSWSLAFFLGVPVAAFLIDGTGLLSPFILMTVLGVISFLVVILLIPADTKPPKDQPGIITNFKLAIVSPATMA